MCVLRAIRLITFVQCVRVNIPTNEDDIGCARVGYECKNRKEGDEVIEERGTEI